MPKKNNRNPSGAGSIRQRPDGRWEGRITLGRDPGTGKQLRRSVYADSQAEVVKLIQQIQTSRTTGAYLEPSRLTLGDWLDLWIKEYLGSVKPSTVRSYSDHVKNRIKPALGALSLQKIKPHQIQAFYNAMQLEGLSAKTVHNIHGILHSALKQAVRCGYVNANISEMCTLPRIAKKEMKILDGDAVAGFLEAIKGHRFEAVFFIDLFTGLRQSEILGLTWDCVDFEKGTITISKQLIKERKKQGRYYLDSTKTDNIRKLNPAPVVMQKLKIRQHKQIENQLRAGAEWCNEMNLVFTDELGNNLSHSTLYKNYKRIVKSMGLPDLRFHDLRHSFAVISIMSGDDIKTVQDNLGHSTISTTLDVYGHVTEKMKEESANRMQKYIDSIGEA